MDDDITIARNANLTRIAELAEAKTYLTGSYALRFDNSRKIASQLQGIQRQNLGIDYIIKRNDLVNAVTIDDIRRVARRLIKADALVFTVVGKPKGLENVPTLESTSNFPYVAGLYPSIRVTVPPSFPISFCHIINSLWNRRIAAIL